MTDDENDNDHDEEEIDEDIIALSDSVRSMERTFDTILFKVEDVIEKLGERAHRLDQLESKVQENMKRLNDMILEVKGIVQIVRGR